MSAEESALIKTEPTDYTVYVSEPEEEMDIDDTQKIKLSLLYEAHEVEEEIDRRRRLIEVTQTQFPLPDSSMSAAPTVHDPTFQDRCKQLLDVDERKTPRTCKRVAALAESKKKQLATKRLQNKIHFHVLPGSPSKAKVGHKQRSTTREQTFKGLPMSQNKSGPSNTMKDGSKLTVPRVEAAPRTRVRQPVESEPEDPLSLGASTSTEPTVQPATNGQSADPLFAVIVDNQDRGDQDIFPQDEVIAEIIIGCDDGSDIDDEEIIDIGIPPPCTSRQVDAAMEDCLSQSNIFTAIDHDNDRHLESLLTLTEFDWKKDPAEFIGLREEFTGQPGPTFSVSELAEPVDCFLKMVEPHFIDQIVTETNIYAQTVIRDLDAAGKLSASSRLRKWYPTTQIEIYRFLGLLIAQGLYPNTVEKGYWSGPSCMALFQNTMSLHRFLMLKKFLHFTNNTTPTVNMTRDEKRLRKIQPVIDYFREQFKRFYYPHQEVAIDESLLNWRGLLSFTQKISRKAAQVGIKSYELCDKNGYLWDFFYYTGSEARRTDDPQVDYDAGHDSLDAGHDSLDAGQETKHDATSHNMPPPTTADHDSGHNSLDAVQKTVPDATSNNMPPPTNSVAKTVIELARALFGKGHTFVMDSYYNCPALARFLKQNKCDCYGTLRLNRQHVPDSLRNLTKTNLNPGVMLSSNTRDLSVVVWRDTGLVSLISTYHKPDLGHQTKNGKTKYKPAVVLDYNKAMGGVDRKDQILSSQPMERSRNLIWYKKLFRHLLNTAIFNSHIIYQSKVPNIAHRTYREQVMVGILRHFVIPKPKKPMVISMEMLTIKGRPPFKRETVANRHWPVRSGLKSGRCVWCTYKYRRTSRTMYKCRECDVNLCIDFCFETYHTPDQK